MAATRLTTKRVEKPWGCRTLQPHFDDVRPGDGAIGEIWFQSPEPTAELLVKYLFTSERLSIQVHPDDAHARAAGHRCGKDEAWVILDAENNASIALGLKQRVNRDALRRAALDGSIEQLLDWRPVKRGDVIYSPAGTIHAIGGGITLIEIQQNIDLTYRLYDYGRPRDLHLDEAVDVAECSPFESGEGPIDLGSGRTILTQGRKFVVERWQGPLDRRTLPDSQPVWLIPLAGSGSIDGAHWEPGECWTCRGEAEVLLSGDADVLVAYPGERSAG